jgi:hypothetical protein
MRLDVIDELVNIWQDAEQEYIMTDNDTPKREAMEQQEAYKLTAEEEIELQKRLGGV